MVTAKVFDCRTPNATTPGVDVGDTFRPPPCNSPGLAPHVET